MFDSRPDRFANWCAVGCFAFVARANANIISNPSPNYWTCIIRISNRIRNIKASTICPIRLRINEIGILVENYIRLVCMHCVSVFVLSSNRPNLVRTSKLLNLVFADSSSAILRLQRLSTCRKFVPSKTPGFVITREKMKLKIKTTLGGSAPRYYIIIVIVIILRDWLRILKVDAASLMIRYAKSNRKRAEKKHMTAHQNVRDCELLIIINRVHERSCAREFRFQSFAVYPFRWVLVLCVWHYGWMLNFWPTTYFNCSFCPIPQLVCARNGCEK